MSSADSTPAPTGSSPGEAAGAGHAGAAAGTPLGLPEAPAAGAPAAIDSVAALVAAREARGLTSSDVVAALKLSARQIAALEAGDWSSLPGLAFTRAALRGYGRLIGVSVEPLAAAIGEGAVVPELREAASLRAPMPRRGLLGFGAGGSGSRLAWIALAIGLLVVMGLFFGREAARESQPGAAAPAPAPASGATPASAAAPSPSAAASAPAAPAPPAFPMLVPTARELVLRFEQESWIEIRRPDGQAVAEGLQRAGTELRLPLTAELGLVVGNAEFVRIERNGVPVDLKPLIRQGVARLKLAP